MLTRPETRKRKQRQRVQRDRNPETRIQRALLRVVVKQCRRAFGDPHRLKYYLYADFR